MILFPFFYFAAGGSVRIPAFFNGIFAHKPSPSIVPSDGHEPGASTVASSEFLGIGPMCRYADDLAPMLKAMAGPNAHELGLDEEVDLSYLKIYTVHQSHFPLLTSKLVDSELLERQKQVCNFLEEKFCATVRDAGIKSFKYSPLIWIAMCSFSNDKLGTKLEDYRKETEKINPAVEIFKSLIGYSKYHWATMSVLLTESFHNSYPGAFWKFFEVGSHMREDIQDLLGNDGILLYPSYPHTALAHQRCSLAPMNFSFPGIFNVMHLPVTQCPLGLNSNGLPLGVQIVAGKNNDKLSIAVAKQLEKEFGGWKQWYPGKSSNP